MSSNNAKGSVTENFCDKISRSIWTQIKENGNNVRMKHLIYNLACTLWHESCLSLETMGCSLNSKTDKIPSSQMLFN